jgi:Flp pilus assembly protein TadG
MLRKLRGGQSMVEFAVLAPVFFMLLLGTIDLGRAIYIYNTISDAAREGARAAVPWDSPLPSTNTVVAAVQSKLGGGFTLTVDPCIAGGTTPCPSTPNNPNTGYIWYSPNVGQLGHQVMEVKITYRFQPWVPVIRDASGNGVIMTADTKMRAEY